MENHESQELSGRYTKGLFGWVKPHAIVTQGLENLLEMCHMAFYLLDLYQDVINIDFNVSINLVFKDLIAKTLVYGSRILQAKVHHLITVKPLVNDKGGFLLHPNLVISGESINKAK